MDPNNCMHLGAYTPDGRAIVCSNCGVELDAPTLLARWVRYLAPIVRREADQQADQETIRPDPPTEENAKEE